MALEMITEIKQIILRDMHAKMSEINHKHGNIMDRTWDCLIEGGVPLAGEELETWQACAREQEVVKTHSYKLIDQLLSDNRDYRD